MVSILSWNTNGLRNVKKFENVIAEILNSKSQITFLQETYWNEEFISKYKHLWPGKIYYSNCNENISKGVAILISPSFKYPIENIETDDAGRIVKICIVIDDLKYSFVNVYAPNIVSERIVFFKDLKSWLKDCPNIVAGDFNEILDPSLDKGINNKTFSARSSKTLHSVIKDFDLIDIWRYRNYDKREFTRQQQCNGVYKQSRIDLCLLSRSLLQYVTTCKIKFTSISDHNMISLKMDFSLVERGPGVWILNNQLLDDCMYTTKIVSIIEEHKSCPLLQSEPEIWWDNLKYNFKRFSKWYASKLKRKEYEEINKIQNKLRIEYDKISRIPNYTSSELPLLEQQLGLFEQKKCAGAILRSKSQFTLESDRCTSYFLNLEKTKQNNNCIKELLLEDDSVTNHTEGILDRCQQFYSQLYSAGEVNSTISEELISLIENSLSDEDKTNCDCPLSAKELSNALNGMNRNKSPGPDGLTVEFYIKFWEYLLPYFEKIVQNIFENSELTPSMKRSNISLFYKNKGEKNDLKNYRPISLINVDCKIISKALSSRLKVVMSSIISPDQTCCIPGRDIANNLHSIRDVVDMLNDRKECNYLVKIDQEKAFDRVSHKFMLDILKKYNFGDNFRKWIGIFYTNIKSSVKCNGHLTPYFKITRGVRQGDPMSSMLYVLISEPLNRLIRSNENIKGVQISDHIHSLIYQHADDTTLTVSSKDSVTNVFRCLEYYCEGTGSKVNLHKSEILVLGNQNQNNLSLDIPVKVNFECIEVLGLYFGTNKEMCESLNWVKKINKLQSLLNLWLQRNLTLHGRATVLNVLITSTLWYSFTVLPVPKWVENSLSRLFVNFLWHNKKAKIAQTTLIGPVNKGGLNIPDLRLKKFSLRLKLLKSFPFSENSIWHKTMDLFLSKYLNLDLGINTLALSFTKDGFKCLSPFYVEILQAWDTLAGGKRYFPTNIHEIMSQPLFHNPNILFNGKTIFFESFVKSKLLLVKDLCFEVILGFLNVTSIVEIIQDVLPEKHVIDIEKCFEILLHALPIEWKHKVSSEAVDGKVSREIICHINETQVSSKHFSSKFCYQHLINQHFREPAALSTWNNYALDLNWKNIWINVNNNDKSSESIQLDFQIAHNVIFTNDKLFKFGKIDTDKCPVCHNEKEDIFHMFIYCQCLKDIQEIIADNLTNVYKEDGFTFGQFSLWLLFGFLPEKSFIEKPVLDIVLATYRLCVYKHRMLASYQLSKPNITAMFKKMLLQHISLLFHEYKKKKRYDIFLNKYINSSQMLLLDNDSISLNI